MHRSCDIRQPHRGFTVIELITVMAILGLLAALLLPAIAASRQAAMRTVCKNRLHQLGVGAHGFVEIHRQYPYGKYIEWMPFFEEANLRETLQSLNSTPTPIALRSLGLSTSTLVCPSDPLADPTIGHVSYMFNEGGSLASYGRGNGIHRGVGTEEISDGLSQTALMAESLIRMRWTVFPKVAFTEDEAGADPLRFLWYIPEAHWPHNVNLRSFNDMCDHQRLGATPLVDASVNFGWRLDHGYNHIRPPNSIGCYDGPPADSDEFVNQRMRLNAVPAQSMHQGGVHVLMCDGSVHFVSDHVDLHTWGAIASRAGGEATPLPF